MASGSFLLKIRMGSGSQDALPRVKADEIGLVGI